MSKHVVVIGGGLGGLSAAIRAQVSGFQVTLLEQSGSLGGKAKSERIGDFRFDLGPSIVILTDIYRDLFKAAGENIDDYLTFTRLDPFTRVFMEGSAEPIDLPADARAALELLASISKSDAQALKHMLDDLDDVQDVLWATIMGRAIDKPTQLFHPHMAKFGAKTKALVPYRNWVDKSLESPMLKAFFYGFPSYSGQTYESPSPSSLLIPYFMLRSGVWYPNGGVGTIPAAFEKLARKVGVKIITNAEVTGLKIEQGKINAVITKSGEVPCDAVISNRDRLTAQAWIGKPCDLKPSYSYWTLHAGIRRRMPELKHHTLFVPKSFESGFEQIYKHRKLPDEPILYVNETTSVDPDSGPENSTNLFAVMTVPAIEPHIDWAAAEDSTIDLVLRTLRKHQIELDVSELEVTRIQSPRTFERRDGSYRGSLYGADEKHRLWGMMPLRCRDEKIKNLFYAGGSVQPGAGMPMVTLSGKFAVDYLIKSIS